MCVYVCEPREIVDRDALSRRGGVRGFVPFVVKYLFCTCFPFAVDRGQGTGWGDKG